MDKNALEEVRITEAVDIVVRIEAVVVRIEVAASIVVVMEVVIEAGHTNR